MSLEEGGKTALAWPLYSENVPEEKAEAWEKRLFTLAGTFLVEAGAGQVVSR